MSEIEEFSVEALIKLHIHPSSKKNEICGTYGDAIKVKLKAPPVNGEANRSCKEFLSKILNLPQKNIELKGGFSSKDKYFLIKGLSKEEVLKRISTFNS